MRKRLLVSVLVGFALFAAACGDDDGGDGSASAADETTTSAGGDASSLEVSGQGIDDDRILIGVSIDKSGVFAPLSAELEAALNARFSVVNDEGGVAGRRVELIVLDDKGDATQALANFRQLWERDKVFAIYTLGTAGPLDYIAQKEIPTFAFAGPPAAFSSKYPTMLPLGSLLPAWNAQTAYSLATYADVKPKKVAVLFDPANEGMEDFVEEYWTALGAEEVIIDPPPSDCSSLVLKYQDADVDYWDFQHAAFIGCLQAENEIGWKPPMGQGGPLASQIAIARLAPNLFEGVVAGSPNRLADGRPTFEEPTPAHQAYLDGMTKYAPEIAEDEAALNGTIPMLIWVGASFMIDALEGAASDVGELSQDTVLDWVWNVEDWDSGIAGPVHRMAPDCKTGNDATIWGYWVEDPNPGGDLILEPFTPDLVDNSWLDVDECYLTQLADEIAR